MKRLYLAVMLLLIASKAYANDGAVVGEGGRWRFMAGEHRNVRMVRENIRIDVYPEYYETDVTFLFKNEGPALTVTMGFPESGGGDIDSSQYKKKTAFTHFATWVDGRRAKAWRGSVDAEDEDYTALWIKKVPFRARQSHTIRVRYRAPHGSAVGEGDSSPYDFTGGNWLGKVQRSDLTVVTHLPGLYYVRAIFEGKVPPFRRDENRFYFRWSNWQAQGGFHFWQKAILRGWMNFEEEVTPLYKDAIAIDTPTRGYYKMVEKTGVYWRPAAALRTGTLYMNLDVLAHWLSRKGEKASEGFRYEAEVDKKQKTLALTCLDDFGRRHSLLWRMGSRRMVLDGKMSFDIPAPFFTLESLDGPNAYVPLKPILQLLGGKAQIDLKNHRLGIAAPRAVFWR